MARRASARPGRFASGFEGGLDGVETLAVVPPTRRLERLEPFLGGLEPPLFLAEVIDARGLDGLSGGRGFERRQAGGQERIEIGQRGGERFFRAHRWGVQADLAF